MRAVFVDANDTLAAVTEKLLGGTKLPVGINRNPSIKSDDLPDLLGDAEIMIVDHTAVPSAIAEKCAKLKHVIFLGTGARSYMNPEELAARGIAVHTIKGYGDTAVAECAIALMWASAKNFGEMDRGMREGNWLRRDAVQLTGKTLGLIGFGGSRPKPRAWRPAAA
ncbi:phosphoglycerate dehydrogenase-like enzyme [Bradyrhizobium sp. USDA 4472]